MNNVLYAVSITLLAAVVSIAPAAFVSEILPSFLDPGLQPIVIAAWVASLASWFVGRHLMKTQRAAAEEVSRQSGGSNKGVAITLGLLVAAVGVIVVLQMFGTEIVP